MLYEQPQFNGKFKFRSLKTKNQKHAKEELHRRRSGINNVSKPSSVTGWRYIWSVRNLIKTGTDDRVAIGAQRLRVECPPGTKVFLCLHPSGHHCVLAALPNANEKPHLFFTSSKIKMSRFATCREFMACTTTPRQKHSSKWHIQRDRCKLEVDQSFRVDRRRQYCVHESRVEMGCEGSGLLHSVRIGLVHGMNV